MKTKGLLKILKWPLVLICIPVLLLFVKQCSEATDELEGEKKALVIAEKMDQPSIELLKKYSCLVRGELKSWLRNGDDSLFYSCSYKEAGDTAELHIGGIMGFSKEFTNSFRFDTAAFDGYSFFKKGERIVKIAAHDKHGNDHIIDSSIPVKELFPNKDPFALFAGLTALQQRFGFLGNDFFDHLSLLQIWTSPQHKLSYLGNLAVLKDHSNNPFIKELTGGIRIKSNWYLNDVYKE